MTSALGSDVVVDALPYIDQGYDDPGVRESALAMVDEECRRYRPTKNYLEHLPPLNLTSFETDVMRAEFERMQNRQPMEPLSMKRYELPPPPTGKLSDLQAWAECVDNSGAQLEHQATRVLNLELMLEYGQETWKSYLEIISSLLNKAQRELQFVRKEMQEINWKRKSLQTQGGEKLRALEAEWVALVSKNYEIEQACVQLEEAIGNELAVKEANTANKANKVNGLQNGEATTTERKRKQTEDMFADDVDDSKRKHEEASLPSNE